MKVTPLYINTANISASFSGGLEGNGRISCFFTLYNDNNDKTSIPMLPGIKHNLKVALIVGYVIGTAIKIPLGMPTSHIGLPGLSPGSSASHPSFLLMCTLGKNNGSRSWVLATPVGALY